MKSLWIWVITSICWLLQPKAIDIQNYKKKKCQIVSSTLMIHKRLCGYVKGHWGILRIHNIKTKIYRKMFPFFQRNHALVCILTKLCRHFINNISNDQYALYKSMSRYFVFDNQVDYNEQLHCLSIAYMYKQKVQH